MRRILPFLIIALAVVLAPAGYADNGENAQAVADAIAKGVAAAAASSGGGIGGMAIAFGSAVVIGLFGVLMHQAQTKWNLFHAQNAIDNARAQVPPGYVPAVPVAPAAAPATATSSAPPVVQ